jgi:hypothetical protein
MTDAYLLLTPLLMLCVVALVGFVGCDLLFGLDEVPPVKPGPTNLHAIAGDGKVDLTWDSFSGASELYVKRSETSGQETALDPPLPSTATSFTDNGVTNGTIYFYVVTARVGGVETQPSNEEMATPGLGALISFVTSKTLGTLRTFNGWVGMGIQVGSRPLMVKNLGRIFAPGNSHAHAIKLVDGATKMDVPGSAAMVVVNTGNVDEFVYTTLPNAVTLNAGADYYLISEEAVMVAGMPGDEFYDSANTSVATTPVAMRVYAVNGDGMGTYNLSPLNDFVYGPLDFQYSIL